MTRLNVLLSWVPLSQRTQVEEYFLEGYEQARFEVALNLLRQTSYDDQMLASLTGLEVEQIRKLRDELQH